MNNIIHTIQHTARATAVLLIALLAAQTAWADTETVSYIDADGNEQTVTATVLTGDVTADGLSTDVYGDILIPAGWYVVKNSKDGVDASYTAQLRYTGDNGTIHLILADGAEMTVSESTSHAINLDHDYPLAIYGQSGGTGRLTVTGKSKGIVAQGGMTINGGIVNVTATGIASAHAIFVMNGITINGGQVTATTAGSCTGIYIYGAALTIGCRKVSDFVSYSSRGGTGTVNIKSGQTLYAGATAYSGNNVSLPSGTVTLRPYSSDDFSVNDAGTEYTIHTATGWDLFCDMQEAGESFSGKTVALDADITVTRMAGSGDNPFCGNFDGGGNTLTFTADAADNYCAPFVGVKGGTTAEDATTIGNLNVVTTITANDYRHMAGLIALQWGHVNVSGINATVNISSTVGTSNPHDLYPAALVSQASSSNDGTLAVTGCTATGTISTDGKYAAGLVGIVQGTASISDCVSSVTIDSSTSGDGTHGGIVAAVTGSGSIEGCVFNGKLTTTKGTGNCAGFIAWGNGTISNSLYAPAAIEGDEAEVVAGTGDYPSGTFYRGTAPTVTSSYYTRALGTAQGKTPRTVTAADDVTIEAVALTGTATQYNVSGITAYSGGGLQLGENLYYGSGDQLSLTLSNTGAPAGYQYAGYTASAGTLDDNNILTMPDEDVTVSVNTAVLTVLPWSGDGSKGNPYIIYNKDQLDLLAHRVNGTHGETCQEDGYEGVYFKLNNDISYPHTSAWNDFTSNESNFEAIGGYYDGNYRYFHGHFDGNNKTISGIRIYKDGTGAANSYQGIFGWTDSGADIHDLTLADARITGYDNTGGIVGYNYGGTVARCHVVGDVAVCAVQSDAYYHGGIVGRNDGTIEQCTSAATLTTADATSTQYYGGIAGRNSGTLHDNLAIGATVPATADNRYGAITGYNDGTLERNYYAACKVNDTENATGVGCGYIGNDDDGYTTADVTDDNGAVCINTLALTARVAPDGNYWTTYYNSALGFTIDDDEHACAYTATYGTGQLTLHKLGKQIPKGTAVIIVADNDEVSMAATTDLPAYSGTNDLRGADVDTPVADITSDLGEGTLYVLGMTTVNDEQHFGFHRYTGADMAAHKAFVHVSGTAAARSLTMVFDEATGIESAEADSSLFTLHSSLSTWFTLDGRRLQAKPTAPGIYVNNGRKVVIK